MHPAFEAGPLLRGAALRVTRPRVAVLRAVHRHPHSVVCRSCGDIADVDRAPGDPLCLTASDDHGYVVEEVEVVFQGLCPPCTAAASGSAVP